MPARAIRCGCPRRRALNPRNELGAGPMRAAETVADKPQEHIEDAPSIRAERDCAPHRDLPFTHRAGPRTVAEHGDRMPLPVEMASQNVANLSAAAGNDDLHGRYRRHSADSAISLIAAFRSRRSVSM